MQWVLRESEVTYRINRRDAELLKRVLDRAVYKKTVRERWNPGGSDMTVTIYPKLPK